jgi:hypothetical protein
MRTTINNTTGGRRDYEVDEDDRATGMREVEEEVCMCMCVCYVYIYMCVCMRINQYPLVMHYTHALHYT